MYYISYFDDDDCDILDCVSIVRVTNTFYMNKL